MVRRAIGFFLMVVLLIAISTVQTAQVQSTRESPAQRDDGYYLAGNFDAREATFETREGRRGCRSSPR